MNTGAATDLRQDAPALSQWVEAALGGQIERCERTAIGGSRTTYLVDLLRGTERLPVVVRCEGEGSFTGTELTLAREATAYRALAETPVPSPAVLAERPDGSAVVLERLPGTSVLDELADDERRTAIRQFVDALATLHCIDPDDLDLPGYARPRSPEDHARLDIAMWQRLAEHVEDLDPLIAYCGAWLIQHAPQTVARTCFVQGDTGPGNFLVEGGHVTGLVDFEFAHLGDPMDDLAWVLMRSRLERDAADGLLEQYERVSGVPIDEDSLRYYRLAVDYRCAITTSLAVTRGGGARGFAPYLLQTQRYLDSLARRLAAIAGVDAPVMESASPPTPRQPLYDQLLGDIRTAVKALDDAETRERVRNAQIYVHHLRACDQHSDDLDAQDRQDRTATLGGELTAAGLLQRATAAGWESDREVLAYLLRRQARRRILWKSLLDRLH